MQGSNGENEVADATPFFNEHTPPASADRPRRHGVSTPPHRRERHSAPASGRRGRGGPDELRRDAEARIDVAVTTRGSHHHRIA